MDVEWILGISAVLLIVALWLSKNRRLEALEPHGGTLGSLAEVVRSAEIANSGFFRSLELVQKNLESLIGRAENVEQKLQALMLHPTIEKRDQYTAAALLLAEGQQVDRVASMLNLSVAQVQLIRELQQMTPREKRSSARAKRTDEVAPKEAIRQTKSSAPREKSAVRPILLVDAIKSATQQSLADANETERFEGATA